jgi:ABC-type polysaccharide/polyol phosphate transport system ATPase subunit
VTDVAPEDVVLEVDGLGKKFARDLRLARRYGVRDITSELRPRRERRQATLRRGEFWALQDVTFSVRRGEALGVIGHNGAGKTTLLRLLNHLLLPDTGSVRVRGRTAAMIDLGVPFSAVLSARENIVASAQFQGVEPGDIEVLVDKVAEFAGLRPVLDAPIRTLSTGMQLRLGYAIAAQSNPALLLVDEVIAVGDIAFQRRCVQHITRYLNEGGSLVMVSHDLWMVQAICRRCLVVRDGRVIDDTTPNRAISSYLSAVRSAEVASDAPSPPDERDGDGAPVESSEGPPPAIVVDALVVTGEDGAPPRTRRPLEISIRAHSTEVPREVAWRLEIHTANLALCVSRLDPPSGSSPLLVPQEGASMTCRIPDLPLYAGYFHVTVRFIDPLTGDDLPVESPRFSFEVEGNDTRLEMLAQLTAAVTTIDGTFEVVSPL